MQHFTLTKTESGWDNADLANYFKSVPPGQKITISISSGNEVRPGQTESTSIEKIERDLTHLELLCSTQIDYNEPTAVMHLLNDLSSWLSYSGRVKADIYALNLQANAVELGKILNDQRYSKIGATERNAHAKALCWQTEAMVMRADRINAAITHRCDHLRSFLSYQKQEMALAGTQQG